jgi:hypothetical protein
MMADIKRNGQSEGVDRNMYMFIGK